MSVYEPVVQWLDDVDVDSAPNNMMDRQEEKLKLFAKLKVAIDLIAVRNTSLERAQ